MDALGNAADVAGQPQLSRQPSSALSSVCSHNDASESVAFSADIVDLPQAELPAIPSSTGSPFAAAFPHQLTVIVEGQRISASVPPTPTSCDGFVSPTLSSRSASLQTPRKAQQVSRSASTPFTSLLPHSAPVPTSITPMASSPQNDLPGSRATSPAFKRSVLHSDSLTFGVGNGYCPRQPSTVPPLPARFQQQAPPSPLHPSGPHQPHQPHEGSSVRVSALRSSTDPTLQRTFSAPAARSLAAPPPGGTSGTVPLHRRTGSGRWQFISSDAAAAVPGVTGAGASPSAPATASLISPYGFLPDPVVSPPLKPKWPTGRLVSSRTGAASAYASFHAAPSSPSKSLRASLSPSLSPAPSPAPIPPPAIGSADVGVGTTVAGHHGSRFTVGTASPGRRTQPAPAVQLQYSSRRTQRLMDNFMYLNRGNTTNPPLNQRISHLFDQVLPTPTPLTVAMQAVPASMTPPPPPPPPPEEASIRLERALQQRRELMSQRSNLPSSAAAAATQPERSKSRSHSRNSLRPTDGAGRMSVGGGVDRVLPHDSAPPGWADYLGRGASSSDDSAVIGSGGGASGGDNGGIRSNGGDAGGAIEEGGGGGSSTAGSISGGAGESMGTSGGHYDNAESVLRSTNLADIKVSRLDRTAYSIGGVGGTTGGVSVYDSWAGSGGSWAARPTVQPGAVRQVGSDATRLQYASYKVSKAACRAMASLNRPGISLRVQTSAVEEL